MACPLRILTPSLSDPPPTQIQPPQGWLARPTGYDGDSILIRICGKQTCDGDDGAYTLKTAERGGMYLSDFRKLAPEEVGPRQKSRVQCRDGVARTLHLDAGHKMCTQNVRAGAI